MCCCCSVQSELSVLSQVGPIVAVASSSLTTENVHQPQQLIFMLVCVILDYFVDPVNSLLLAGEVELAEDEGPVAACGSLSWPGCIKHHGKVLRFIYVIISGPDTKMIRFSLV